MKPLDYPLKALAMLAAGKTPSEVAAALQVHTSTVRYWKRRFKQHSIAEGDSSEPEPKATVIHAIRQAAALTAAGLQRTEIARQLGRQTRTIDDWRRRYPERWKSELGQAMEPALFMVRAQAGTSAVSEDPESYIRRAVACEKWTRSVGRELFPTKSKSVTLTTFFETVYRPLRLNDASKETLRTFREVLKRWRLLTGDPPLKAITQETLIHYRDCLQKTRGRRRGTWMSPTSIHKCLNHVESVLNKAGPPGYRNRDAAGLIQSPPWIKKPRPMPKPVRVVTDEEFDSLYLATVAMDAPAVPGVRAPMWWRVLLVIARNTGLRTRTLLTMRMEHIDWERNRLDLPPRLMKSGLPFTTHLNPTAISHLRQFRTDRELVFPWPFNRTGFYRALHRLQTVAGIPPDRQFGMHEIRKTLSTMLWEESPQAAQYALGHSRMEVTRHHYVQGMGIVARALDHLPQPQTFLAGLS